MSCLDGERDIPRQRLQLDKAEQSSTGSHSTALQTRTVRPWHSEDPARAASRGLWKVMPRGVTGAKTRSASSSALHLVNLRQINLQ